MTIVELRKLLNDAKVEYCIKQEKGNLVKINIWIEDENDGVKR